MALPAHAELSQDSVSSTTRFKPGDPSGTGHQRRSHSAGRCRLYDNPGSCALPGTFQSASLGADLLTPRDTSRSTATNEPQVQGTFHVKQEQPPRKPARLRYARVL